MGRLGGVNTDKPDGRFPGSTSDLDRIAIGDSGDFELFRRG